MREGLVDGLRIDHPDGLADPRGLPRAAARRPGVEHVWVEKILEPGEQLRDWPVEGTAGYEFLNDVTALFVDPAGEAPLTELYARADRRARPFAEVAPRRSSSRRATTFAPEVERLRRELRRRRPGARGGARRRCRVYRTYVEPERARSTTTTAPRSPRPACRRELARDPAARGARPRRVRDRFQQTTPPVTAKGVEDTAFYRYEPASSR